MLGLGSLGHDPEDRSLTPVALRATISRRHAPEIGRLIG
jgi:hypothetical protein